MFRRRSGSPGSPNHDQQCSVTQDGRILMRFRPNELSVRAVRKTLGLARDEHLCVQSTTRRLGTFETLRENAIIRAERRVPAPGAPEPVPLLDMALASRLPRDLLPLVFRHLSFLELARSVVPLSKSWYRWARALVTEVDATDFAFERRGVKEVRFVDVARMAYFFFNLQTVTVRDRVLSRDAQFEVACAVIVAKFAHYTAHPLDKLLATFQNRQLMHAFRYKM